jgi:Fe-S cluster assembly iron-binding protein IscA
VKNGLLNEGLEFINPNARSSCGCGESIAFEKTA